MLPVVGVPTSVEKEMEKFREAFWEGKSFESVSRYVTGLICSPNKTLQGIYDMQVWGKMKLSRRRMHEAVFELGWDPQALMQKHRKEIAREYKGKGKTVVSLDWTFAHHNRGPCIFGIKRLYDYVQKKNSLVQTLVTAVASNRNRIDGLEVAVHEPSYEEEEKAYLKETDKESYTMEESQKRLLELLYHLKNKKLYKKKTELALDLVKQIEEEKLFEQNDYAFDNGVLTIELTQYIESCDKHWISEIEHSRKIQLRGEWRSVGEVAATLVKDSPQSFRYIQACLRNGEKKDFWIFRKAVRLRKYGKKRLFIVHEQQDLLDEPRFLLTDALFWEGKKALEIWSYRWTAETFHEFSKQVTGLESSQVRNEKSVKRHFHLSCVAQSVLQSSPAFVSTSERFAFAHGGITFGQKWKSIIREVFLSLLYKIQLLFQQGRSCNQVLEALMPI